MGLFKKKKKKEAPIPRASLTARSPAEQLGNVENRLRRLHSVQRQREEDQRNIADRLSTLNERVHRFISSSRDQCRDIQGGMQQMIHKLHAIVRDLNATAQTSDLQKFTTHFSSMDFRDCISHDEFRAIVEDVVEEHSSSLREHTQLPERVKKKG